MPDHQSNRLSYSPQDKDKNCTSDWDPWVNEAPRDDGKDLEFSDLDREWVSS